MVKKTIPLAQPAAAASTRNPLETAMNTVIPHLMQSKGIQFPIYIDGVEGIHPCKLGNDWTLCSVTANAGEFSFIAKQNGKQPMKYWARNNPSRKGLEAWFLGMAAQITEQGNKVTQGEIPADLYLYAGITDYAAAKAAVVA